MGAHALANRHDGAESVGAHGAVAGFDRPRSRAAREEESVPRAGAMVAHAVPAYNLPGIGVGSGVRAHVGCARG